MQYQPETEKVFMMNNPCTPAFRPVPLTEDHEVQRTRKILMIILTVLLVSFCFIEIYIYISGEQYSSFRLFP